MNWLKHLGVVAFLKPLPHVTGDISAKARLLNISDSGEVASSIALVSSADRGSEVRHGLLSIALLIDPPIYISINSPVNRAKDLGVGNRPDYIFQ